MTWTDELALVLSVGMFAYLVLALLKPEWFQ